MHVRILTLCALVLILAACGGDEPAAGAAKPAAPQAVAPAAPAPAAEPAEEAAAMDEEELVYDPIDVSKLENQWWQQYSNGG